jgi:tetratricopeptide (TPR) repeat protein
MAKEWLEELEKNEKEGTQEWIKKEKIDRNDPGSHYSKIYERRFRLEPAGGFFRLQKEMENAIPSPGYYYLAQILDKTHNKLVITTNFDSLTEDSLYTYTDTKALVITHESLAAYIDALPNRPTVIKIHRDLLLQPKSSEADVGILSEELKDGLKKILDIYVPIVIGYGGNDGSLMDFLENVPSIKDKNIYWCYIKGNPVNDQIRQLLEKSRGFLIPIDDFDDTMHLFGVAFGYNFSDKTIQKITNRRAEKLIEKYNEWRSNRQETLDKKESKSETETMTLDSFRNLSKRNIDELEKQIVEEPGNANNYNQLGKEYFLENEYGKAVDCHTKAIELKPNNAEYYYNRGLNYNWLKEYEKAIADISKAIELKPNNAKYYYNRGINYNWLREFENAITDISKAIELKPDIADYYYYRGINYSWLNEHEKAIADMSKAAELAPDNADYYLRLARILCYTGDFDDALKNVTTAMFLDDTLPFCYNVRGFIGLKKAKHDKAGCKPDVLDEFNKAIELNKDDKLLPLFYTDRGEYYLYSNSPDKARSDLERALAIYNKYGRAYFHLARYYEKQGNSQECDRNMSRSKECRFIPNDSDY